MRRVRRSSATQVDSSVEKRPKTRTISLLTSGVSQFSGQSLGIIIAILVSHLIARRLGAGPEADAFLLGRRLVTSLSESLNQIMVVVFIPLIAARAAQGDSMGRILSRAGGAALGIGVGLAAIFAWSAPVIVAAVAPEFGPETATLAERVVLIMAMSLPATVATIAFAAYCNAKGHFGVPAAIRQVPRAAVAMALLLGAGALATQAAAAYTIACFAVAALILIVAVAIPKEKFDDTGTRIVSSAVERRGIAAIFLTVGALASIWLETAFAARQGVGAVAMLDFSQRLGALCGNTLAMALALVIFADLSRRYAAGDTSGLSRRFGQASVTAMALLLPLQIGIIANAAAIVDVIIAHGNISADAAARVVQLLRWMALAPIGALVTRMLLVRILAQQDLPIVRLIGGSMVLDIMTRLSLFVVLTPQLGLLAIPVALTAAPIAQITFLGVYLRRRGALVWNGALVSSRPVLAASALGCAAILAGAALGPALANVLLPVLRDMPKFESLAQLGASGLLGGLALAVGVKVFGVRLRPS